MQQKNIFRQLCLALCLLLSATVDAEISDIDSDQLKQMIEQGVVLIDLRRTDEWSNTGIIENSHLVTFFDQYGTFDSGKWLREISEFADEGKPIVLICHAGVRSEWVARWLDKNTEFDTIYNANGGIQDWIRQGFPLSKTQ